MQKLPGPVVNPSEFIDEVRERVSKLSDDDLRELVVKIENDLHEARDYDPEFFEYNELDAWQFELQIAREEVADRTARAKYYGTKKELTQTIGDQLNFDGFQALFRSIGMVA